MVEFRHYKGIGKENEEIEVTIASGPVIIEKDKVLLDKHGDDRFWKFPGGSHLDDSSFEDTAKIRVKEELGIDVEIKGEPCILIFERKHNGKKGYVVLIHYLAKRIGDIRKGSEIREYKWIDVNKLPEDIGPNIKPVLRYFKVI